MAPYFMNEARSRTADPYPPKTTQSLLADILRYMNIQKPSYPKYFNKEKFDLLY